MKPYVLKEENRTLFYHPFQLVTFLLDLFLRLWYDVLKGNKTFVIQHF